MRIGLLTTSFPRFEGDIPGAFVLGFARSLANLGHSLEVLCPEPAYEHAAPDFAGIDVRWVSYLRPRSLQQTFYGAGVLDNLKQSPATALGLVPFSLRLAQRARQRAQTWDAIVSHWALPCALVAGQIRRRIPHLAVMHSADVALLERLPGSKQLARNIARGATAMLFSSLDLRRRFAALLDPLERAEHAASMHVCAMGIGPPKSAEEPRCALRKRLGLSRFTVLSLGRLIPIKGLRNLLDAMGSLPDIELVIAGNGPERAALEARARGARVRFVGEVRGAEKAAWFSAADAFVLPSIKLRSGRTEGMPTTLLEAMHYGLPVVASAVGGIPDVLENDWNGLLIAPENRLAIVRALSQLSQSPTLCARLSVAARDTAKQYDWDTLGPHFFELLTAESGR